MSRAARLPRLRRALIPVLLVVGMLGPILVFPSVYRSGWIFRLDDVALVGSIAAFLVALAFGAPVLSGKSANPIGNALFASVFCLSDIAAVVIIAVRVQGGELVGAAVGVAAALFSMAALVHACTAAYGWVRTKRG